ncbi:SDR family NAD(P)-dependent oxidoreductase [Alkalihalophilus sp. As8PL]|uniref:SDR family NAD(P)-dependent oxidoreductase n=1 Tax=Alkalihalophilus sp. As8PL TaxID=3237103 RepID=A0AB39BWH0_9BACI
MNLQDQVAIITGSTRGIGYSLARQLAANGTGVIINSRKEADVSKVVEEINDLGGRAVGLASPVNEPHTGEELVHLAVERFGKVTILINNAGNTQDRMAYKMSDDEFQSVISVHVNGTFYCTRAFIQQVIKQETGGQILNMTSTAGLTGTIGQLNYSAAKSAINGMTWTLAKELERHHIKVNAVAPAALTSMTEPHINRARKKAAEQGMELPTYWEVGSTDDVARFVTTLFTQPQFSKSGEIFGVNGDKLVRWQPSVPEEMELADFINS